MSGALPFVIRRLLVAIPVLFLVSAGTFALGRYAPGDPVTVRTGGKVSPERADAIRESLGLNDPIPVQYVRYMGKFLRGDLGESYKRPGIKISEIIFPKMWVSFQLNLIPFFLTYLVGIPLGIYVAFKRGQWQDPTIVSILLMLASIPTVVMIPILVNLFSTRWHLVPTTGWHGIFSRTIILPVIVLTIGSFAGIARVVRISMLQVMGEDYIRTARAKGLRESTVIGTHMLRNSLLVIINGVITSLFFLFSGTLFVEIGFGIPGLGREAYDSIGSRDYDMFMALTMFSAIAFVLANLVLDILYTIIDPRIRYS
jgi:peptide/nickel transport system permease protein